MTKIRPSLTVEGALDRAIGILGREGAASTIGKTEATVYAYGNPDSEKHLSLKDAMLLDLECASECGETPFFTMQEVTQQLGNFRGRVDITGALLDLHASAGRMTEAYRSAKAPQSPGGKRITQAEAAQILRITDQVLTTIMNLRAQVTGDVVEQVAA